MFSYFEFHIRQTTSNGLIEIFFVGFDYRIITLFSFLNIRSIYLYQGIILYKVETL